MAAGDSPEDKRRMEAPALDRAPEPRAQQPARPANPPGAAQAAAQTRPDPAAAQRAAPAAAAKPAAKPGQRNLSLVTFPERRVKPKAPPERGLKQWIAPQGVRLRHVVIRLSFLIGVVLPVALVSGYLFFIAQDQYHSRVSFAVRSIEGSSAADLMGFFTSTSTGDPVSDSYILTDYIRSREMYEAVSEDVDLQQVFARRGADWYFSMDQDLPIEERVDYWNSMVHVDFDSSSGIMTVEAKAFEPDDAQRVAQSILTHSTALVNDLSAAAREEIVASAENDLAAAEDRLREARSAMRAYRDRTQEIDPVENARMAAELIGSLEQELARLNSELNTALAQMGPESPRVRVMEQQISSLELQIAMERMRLGSGGEEGEAAAGEASSATPDVADRIQDYEALQTEAEFAQQAYLSSMASLEKARSDADRKQRYLATFLYPDQAQQSEYPRRLLLIVLSMLGFGFVWGVGVMLYYNLKDRA